MYMYIVSKNSSSSDVTHTAGIYLTDNSQGSLLLIDESRSHTTDTSISFGKGKRKTRELSRSRSCVDAVQD